MSISSGSIVEAEGLGKRYGEVVALQDVSFSVGAGETLGLLGPNGAGKTTAVKLLTTLASIDSGRATIAGHDVASQPVEVRRSIGLAGQAAAVDERLSARENLEFFGRLYKLDRRRVGERADALIERFDMGAFADRPASTYSGGQRRRLDIAAALVAVPPALFLDEPTTGLDPRSRAEVWDEVRSIAEEGAAVVLTTQYLDEADRLADRVVVIDEGQMVASGPTDALKAKVGRDILEVRLTDARDLQRAGTELALPEGTQISDTRLELHIPIEEGSAQSLGLLRAIDDRGLRIADFSVRRPTLDDAFLALTGAPTKDEIRA